MPGETSGGLFMLTRIGRFVVRRRRPVLVVAAIVFAVAGAFGGTAAEHLTSGGFDDPSSQPFTADEALPDTLRTGSPTVVMLVPAHIDNLADHANSAAGPPITPRLLTATHVDNVPHTWSPGCALPTPTPRGP